MVNSFVWEILGGLLGGRGVLLCLLKGFTMCGIGVIKLHCLIRLSYTDVSVYLSIPSHKQPLKPIKHINHTSFLTDP